MLVWRALPAWSVLLASFFPRVSAARSRSEVDVSSLETGGRGHSKIIPDKQMYESSVRKSKRKLDKLVSDEVGNYSTAIHDRIARCYEPRVDRNYSGVQWKTALDAYMQSQVKSGLEKWSRVYVYDMPHVWGDRWYTKYFPHHWMAAIVPDVKVQPSTYCLKFDYANATNQTADPAGCLFFRKSFEPTQQLTKCVFQAMENSTSWANRRLVIGTRNLLEKVKLNFTVGLIQMGRDAFINGVDAWHAKWNEETSVHLAFNHTGTCNWRGVAACPEGSKLLREVKSCQWGVSSDDTAELECQKNVTGDSKILQALLVGRRIVDFRDGCNASNVSEIDMPAGSVALVTRGNCMYSEKADNARAKGAVALLVQHLVLVKEQKNTKKPHSAYGSASLPMLMISKKAGKSLRKDPMTVISAYEDQPLDAGIKNKIDNFEDEVLLWRKEQEADRVASVTLRARVYEMLKYTATADLGKDFETARAALRAAMERSMTQPKGSSMPAVDAETEAALFSCFGVSPEDEREKLESSLTMPRDHPHQAFDYPQHALLLQEASKCLPAMWDKVEVPGPPYPQVWDASSSFPGDNLKEVDEIKLHPVCGRMAVALNAVEMTEAPYPDPSEWEPGENFSWGTGFDAMKKGNPRWLRNNALRYCMNPDTALCTSYATCFTLLARHVTQHIHRFCNESLRVSPELPILVEEEEEEEE